MKYSEVIKEQEIIDADGNTTLTRTSITKEIKNREEPDYIKIYTRMWCEFQGVPEKWRELFLQLCLRMSYASPNETTGGQLVNTGGPYTAGLLQACGWKTPDPLYKGLKVLCDYKAIRKITRGIYQINPQYAGKGSWRYNPQEERGGVQDLIAKFDFAAGTVDTQIIYTNDPHKTASRLTATVSGGTDDDDAGVTPAVPIKGKSA